MTDSVALRGLEVRVGERVLVQDVGLDLQAGRVVGLVGASGSGKTLTARSLLGLVDLQPGVVKADLEIQVNGRVQRPYDACLGKPPRARDRAFQGIRGDLLGYLPQDARAALDPLFPVGKQVRDASADGNADPRALLVRAGLPDADRVLRLYPHELSGGMAQRVVIAQALARRSRFLVCDEPTTALDATVQHELLAALRALCAEGIGLLLITHDLRLLPGFADDLVVMDQGRVVERADPNALVSGSLSSQAARTLLRATRRIAGGRLG
jgi:ABC-type glutathione transport system ATPase component